MKYKKNYRKKSFDASQRENNYLPEKSVGTNPKFFAKIFLEEKKVERKDAGALY
jgi:hypothetical protein